MDLAYTCAYEAIPFIKFGSLAESQKRAGVQLGETYLNDRGVKDFTMTLGDEMEDQLKQQLLQTDFITVLVDGSTDCAVLEKELFYVRFVDCAGCVSTKLLALKNAESADAEGLLKALTKSFTDIGLDNFTEHLIGFMSDGASVNFGKKACLLTKLRHEMPWLIGIHCLNHRLELAIKDAFKGTVFDEICTLLSNIHAVFERSSKRLRALHALGEVMEEDCKKPARTNGTRWIQHKLQAASILLKQYGLIVLCLTSITDDSKVSGYVKRMKLFKTVTHLQLFVDLLSPIGRLSEHLQGETTNLLLAQSALESTLLTLKRTNGAVYSEPLTKLVEDAKAEIAKHNAEKHRHALDHDGDLGDDSDTHSDNQMEIEFQSIGITNLKQGLSSLEKSSLAITSKLSDCISQRFHDVLSHSESGSPNPVIAAVKILDIKAWPQNRSELHTFGESELSLVTAHFEKVLAGKVDCAEVSGEWLCLKLYVADNLQHLQSEECWSVLSKSKGKAFTNVMTIINMLRIFPVSNAIVERCFSTMTKVKTDWRNRLGEKEVEHLIRIKKEGPVPGTSGGKLLIESAVDRFFQSKIRRGDK